MSGHSPIASSLPPPQTIHISSICSMSNPFHIHHMFHYPSLLYQLQSSHCGSIAIVASLPRPDIWLYVQCSMFCVLLLGVLYMMLFCYSYVFLVILLIYAIILFYGESVNLLSIPFFLHIRSHFSKILVSLILALTSFTLLYHILVNTKNYLFFSYLPNFSYFPIFPKPKVYLHYLFSLYHFLLTKYY